MIDIKELRIGNWVEHNDEWCYRGEDVYQFQWDDSDWYALGESTMFIQNIEPIPLTEQWLIDFGFEKRKHYYSLKGFDLTINGWMGFQNFVFQLKHIEYIHQLQNLFYILSNEELQLHS